MTSIICTMSQLLNNYQESKETLNFGAKAKQVKTVVNVNELIRDSPEEVAARMHRLTRENEDLRAKLSAAKVEVLTAMEQKNLEGAALSNMKAHQAYLMQLIEEKNLELAEKEERGRRQEGLLED